jgi:two-component system, OmpR family, sensor kinase
VSPLRGVGGRLALSLLVIVAGVLAIVYVIIVPSYRRSLENTELRALAADLRHEVPGYPGALSPEVDLWAGTVSERYDVRAVVFDVTPVPESVAPFADSNTASDDSELADDPVALSAVSRTAPAQGIVTRDDRRFAEAAYPLSARGPVLVFMAPLTSQVQSVAVVRRRVLIAGGLAIGFAVVLGYAGAAVFARRIRRLESAVERIADGEFTEAVVDPGTDELAQLARAVERMRLRLSQLDRARGEFIANASHELRTPLFSLAGFLELLDDPSVDDETREEFLAQMRTQVERLTKLATDLLDLSRLDAGRLTVVTEEVDLAELAHELAAEFRARAEVSGHVLELGADDAVPARCDAARALQIGRVLVENALVHTLPGTTVRISSTLDGGRAALAVSDNGPGIPTENRRQIFERFHRLEGTKASGSGLGLAIARELAEVMGGRLELDDAAGWTSFTLVLSAAVDADDRFPVKTDMSRLDVL